MSNECVRELTSKELIEQSDCKNKELILSRLKAENERNCNSLLEREREIDRQRILITSYREVLKDMIYSSSVR